MTSVRSKCHTTNALQEALACHEGILMCSIAIKNHLERHRVLQEALDRGRQHSQQQQLQQPQQGLNPGMDHDYKLIITGD